MDNYENEDIRQEFTQPDCQPQEPVQPVYERDPYQQTYHGAGAGRKESPFVNSPYVSSHTRPAYEPNQYQNSYVPPQEPPRKAKKEKKSGGKVWKNILCAVLALAVVAGSCGLTAMLVNNKWETRTAIMEGNFDQRLDALQAQIDANAANRIPEAMYQDGTIMTPGAVYERNMQTVVLIKAQVRATTMFGQSAIGTSSGSGFVLTEDGFVVTNHHVVDKATKVNVVMHDGTEYEATVVGSDDTNDVAVLKIKEAVNLTAVEIGSSDTLNVGDQVIAIGNPLGELTSTLTVGYVSAKERSIKTDGTTINMIQTDAAINSGNSGGPLFNAMGQVVGITTAKFSGSSSSGASIEGIGFAIPINDVMPLIDDLRNLGYITSGYLGVMVKDVPQDMATYYDMPLGARIDEVTPGYCAEAAGLQVKDIITAVGPYKVESVNDLTKALRKFKEGDVTTVTIYRAGQELEIPVTLDGKPVEENVPAPGSGNMPQEGSYDDWYNYFAPFFNGKG